MKFLKGKKFIIDELGNFSLQQNRNKNQKISILIISFLLLNRKNIFLRAFSKLIFSLCENMSRVSATQDSTISKPNSNTQL